MKRKYFCPACNAHLNPNIKIILMARRNGEKGLILLSPQPGNYELIAGDEFSLKEDDLVSLSCPVCSASLTAETDKNLAHLSFRFSNGRDGLVYFSRRYGHHATYLVFEDEVQAFGDDAVSQMSLNYFGSGQSED